MSLPAVTGSGESVFVTATSADAPTVVVAVAESSDGSGSLHPELTVAVLVSTVPAATSEPTCTVSVTPADAPFATAPRLQLTVVAIRAQAPCEGVAETNVVPLASGSVSVTPDAPDGPLFATPIVYVRSVPEVTGSGVSVLVTARSAVVVTVVVAAAELLPELGSAVDELAVAVLASTVPPATPVPTFT